MTDEDKVVAQEEESNIDQINSFVTSSKEESEVEEVQKVEEKQEEEKPVVKERVKEKEPEKTEKKIEKPHHEKHVGVKHVHAKKPEPKKEEKKVEVKHKAKSEPKKVVKEVKAKKIIFAKKPVKEEKMKNHKERKKPSKVNKNVLMWIGIGVLAVILIIALIFILTPNKTKPLTNTTNNSVAATVNGEPIYLQTVMSEYNKLNPVYQSMYSVESILNKSIDDLLLYQEAKSAGITVDVTEVDKEIDDIKITNQLTDSAFEEALAQQGLTVEDVETLIEKNLMIRKLLNVTILNDIKVTESQIENYYELNIETFKVPEKVTVQHILVMITPNVTDEMAKAKIEQVKSELTADNFCELVTKYTEDSGSIYDCGKYTFAKGEFQNPEFENPSFDLNVGETTIVKTVFGYHLIKKLESIPAKTLSLSEAQADIESIVYNQIAQEKFDELLQGLRDEAEIVNYMTKTDSNETVIPEIRSLDDFAKCITEKGAVFYGASWCSHCNNQKKGFGDSMQYINYVECAVEGQPQVQTKACTDADISGYPTWKINGKDYPGEQTLANLAKLTGCALP